MNTDVFPSGGNGSFLNERTAEAASLLCPNIKCQSENLLLYLAAFAAAPHSNRNIYLYLTVVSLKMHLQLIKMSCKCSDVPPSLVTRRASRCCRVGGCGSHVLATFMSHRNTAPSLDTLSLSCILHLMHLHTHTCTAPAPLLKAGCFCPGTLEWSWS